MFKHLVAGFSGVLRVGVLVAVAGGGGGCAPGAGKAPSAKVGDAWVIVRDVSASIPAQDDARWRSILDAILARLGPGDSIQVFGAHALASAPPLSEETTRPLPAEPTLQEQLAVRTAIKAARARSREAFTTAAARRPPGNTTDLLGLLSRLRPGARVFVFSDGLHADGVLNLERVKVDEAKLPDLIERLAPKYGWRRGMLAGTSIAFCLSTPPSTRRPANGVPDLERFWRSVIVSLGGTLRHFDTTNPGLDAVSKEGV